MNDEVRARSQAAIEKKRKRKDSCHLYNYRLFQTQLKLGQVRSGQISQIKMKDALSKLK